MKMSTSATLLNT